MGRDQETPSTRDGAVSDPLTGTRREALGKSAVCLATAPHGGRGRAVISDQAYRPDAEPLLAPHGGQEGHSLS